MPTPPRRGHLAVALVAALLLISASPGGAAVAAEPADPPAAPPPAPAAMPAPPVLPSQPGWRLRWAPQAATDGLGAFEHAEDDRANSHPEASPHIFVEGDHYRFNMHMVDRDLTTDRQRHEVRGLRTPAGHALNLLKGERWRFTYSAFIPDTLKATTRFSHIMQMKAPGTDSNPIVVESLRRNGSVPTMELRITEGNLLVGAVDLAPLQNHWIDIEFEIGIGDAPDGWVRWVVHNGPDTVIDTTTTGVDTWLFDRVRPKWGIYRSLGDTSGSLQDTYELITNLRAYQWSDKDFPTLFNRYEAERATVRGGTVESTFGGFSGTGYVNLQGAPQGSVEWTVFALAPGPAVLNFWYANMTTIPRPMDITVNGVPVAPGLPFTRTPAWTDWETRTVIATLHFGLNRIRVTATTADGGPNVDSLELQQPSTVAVS